MSVIEIPLWIVTIGEWTIGENTFWESGMLDIISVPIMKKIDFERDNANIFKIAISGKDWSPFYMNQIDIIIGFSQIQKYILTLLILNNYYLYDSAT